MPLAGRGAVQPVPGDAGAAAEPVRPPSAVRAAGQRRPERAAKVAADPFAGRAGAGAGFSRSPTVDAGAARIWRSTWRRAARRAGAARRGWPPRARCRGRRREQIADRRHRGTRRLEVVGSADLRRLCAAGLSAARADAGRDVGAGRSLPSGGGLDPVTTVCPLLQAASSTLEEAPPNARAMFADSARSAQCWGGGKSTQWIAGE